VRPNTRGGASPGRFALALLRRVAVEVAQPAGTFGRGGGGGDARGARGAGARRLPRRLFRTRVGEGQLLVEVEGHRIVDKEEVHAEGVLNLHPRQHPVLLRVVEEVRDRPPVLARSFIGAEFVSNVIAQLPGSYW